MMNTTLRAAAIIMCCFVDTATAQRALDYGVAFDGEYYFEATLDEGDRKRYQIHSIERGRIGSILAPSGDPHLATFLRYDDKWALAIAYNQTSNRQYDPAVAIYSVAEEPVLLSEVQIPTEWLGLSMYGPAPRSIQSGVSPNLLMLQMSEGTLLICNTRFQSWSRVVWDDYGDWILRHEDFVKLDDESRERFRHLIQDRKPRFYELARDVWLIDGYRELEGSEGTEVTLIRIAGDDVTLQALPNGYLDREELIHIRLFHYMAEQGESGLQLRGLGLTVDRPGRIGQLPFPSQFPLRIVSFNDRSGRFRPQEQTALSIPDVTVRSDLDFIPRLVVPVHNRPDELLLFAEKKADEQSEDPWEHAAYLVGPVSLKELTIPNSLKSYADVVKWGSNAEGLTVMVERDARIGVYRYDFARDHWKTLR